MPPFFSIVMATYGRGAHIAPSIQSVLYQTCRDFELIVVGDGCADDTQAVVESIEDPRVAWYNLPLHHASQSGPNNAGIERARGEWICYLGHDDIWAPEHLSLIAATIARAPEADFVVAGCIFYGGEGNDLEWITGLFDAPDAASEHFFPPSSVAHRRDVTARVGPWHLPKDTRAPVDADFMLRSVKAGLRFVSTDTITTHKFAAGHRYLSYLQQESHEQFAMLERLSRPERDWIDAIKVRTAKGGRFMTMRHPDFDAFEPGALFAMNRSNKGLARPALRPLRERTILPQTAETRSIDWHGLDEGFRWSGPSRRPKLLLPFTGRYARVAIEIDTSDWHPPLDRVSVEIGGTRVAHAIDAGAPDHRWLSFDCPLAPDTATIVTLHTPDMFEPRDGLENEDMRRLGLRVGEIVLTPITGARAFNGLGVRLLRLLRSLWPRGGTPRAGRP